MPTCDVCTGQAPSVDPATLLDRDGGAHLNICAGCIEQIATARCRVCGQLKGHHEKADALHVRGETYPVCDDCRKRLIGAVSDALPACPCVRRGA